MRLIIDTNVIISASLKKYSTPFKVMEVVFENHVLLISPEIFGEIKNTVYQSKFDKYFFPEDTRSDILNIVLLNSVVINPEIKITACRDPKDNKYLELALSGKADCIITGDKDLLVLNPFENIPIISPLDFLDKFK